MHTWWSLLTHAPNSLYSLFLSLSLSLCHALTVGCGFHSADLFLYCSFNEKQLSFFSPNLFPSLRSCKGRARPLRSRNSFSPFSPAFFPWTMQFLCRQLGRESETRVREKERVRKIIPRASVEAAMVFVLHWFFRQGGQVGPTTGWAWREFD